jgi:hypothetical protein
MTSCCGTFGGREAKCVYNIRGRRDGVTIWEWRATRTGMLCLEPGEFSAKPLVMLLQSGRQVCIWRCCARSDWLFGLLDLGLLICD